MHENEIINILKDEVSKEEYDRFLSILKFDENSKSDLIIFNAPNIFIANWIRQRYLNKMTKIAEAKYKIKPIIKIEVKSIKEKNNIKLKKKILSKTN